mmetsp:Transcript_28615/g.57695  ORF Transcript_28615/g.57695 Transcript_28615/m.57695 type:complete len:86 (+) Transcript_28615:100-357(+)
MQAIDAAGLLCLPSPRAVRMHRSELVETHRVLTRLCGGDCATLHSRLKQSEDLSHVMFKLVDVAVELAHACLGRRDRLCLHLLVA